MICEIHGVEKEFIKAGVSKKTGKSYEGFYSCPQCKAQKAQGGGYARAEKPSVDWDSLGRKKGLYGMVNARLVNNAPGVVAKEIASLLKLEGMIETQFQHSEAVPNGQAFDLPTIQTEVDVDSIPF